jgi:hypothetical protein
MRGTLRNAIAHLDPNGDSLVADSFADIRACEQTVPVLKYIAREMLLHESETLAQEAVTRQSDKGEAKGPTPQSP